jgi:hypothetical protein
VQGGGLAGGGVRVWRSCSTVDHQGSAPTHSLSICAVADDIKHFATVVSVLLNSSSTTPAQLAPDATVTYGRPAASAGLPCLQQQA